MIMRARLRALTLAVANSLATLSGAAAGQGVTGSAARAHVSRAAELVEARRWAEARAEYNSAFALIPTAVTMSSIAYCLEQEGKLILAAATYRRALDINRVEPKPDGPLEDAILERLGAVTFRIPKLIISAPGPIVGLVVALDGAPVPVEPGGLEVEVDAGPHELVARATGYPDWARTVTLKIGERLPIEIRLEHIVPRPPSQHRESQPAVSAPVPRGEASARSADHTLSTASFVGAGALGLAGAVLAAHTAVRIDGLDGCNNIQPPSARAGCWNKSAGEIEAEGNAIWVVLIMAGAATATGLVLYHGVEGHTQGVSTVELTPRNGGGSLVMRY